MTIENNNSEIEAAVFRRLIKHFQNRPDLQNIDLMILADFCRNCLSKWYKEEANLRGSAVSTDAARELVYGMRYSEWKDLHQTKATQEKLDQLAAKQQ